MDVQIDITDEFEKDLVKISKSDNQIITKKIDYLIQLLNNDQNINRHLYRLHKIAPINDLNSSLYIFKVNTTIRIILTYEDDPIFDQKIITLLRVVNHSKLDKVFKGLQESIYQSYLNEGRTNG
jgi:mRNA-degrading endonuclease YafQ of YafQ-DinJ toxin-antitoxin module